MLYETNPSSDVKCRVTYNPISITEKPNPKEVGKISKGLTEEGEWTISQFVEYTQPPYSYTFSPSTFEGNQRKNNKWRSQQVFVLDFDSGITLEEVYNRFEDHGILPNFYYYTLSHAEGKPRFRVGLVADEEVVNPDVAAMIRKGLTLAFPEADQSCKDAARMFYAGSKGEETSSNPIQLKELYEFSSIHVISNDNFRKRQLLDKNTVSFINTKEYSGYDHKLNIKDPHRLEYLENFKTSGVTVADLSGKVKIFDDFVLGEHLNYHQLRGLATNLQYISGGQKLFLKTLDATGTYKPCDYAVFHFVKNYYYYPTRLENFSPHEEDHQYSDMIEVLRTPRRSIQQVEVIPKILLDEAENELGQKFTSAMEAEDNNIYIFKTATGLGKTRLLENLNNVTVCFPNHDLKDEADSRFTSNHLCVPEKPKFVLESLNELINTYYSIGLADEARRVIQQVAAKQNGYDEFEEDVDKAHNYLQTESDIRNSTNTVLTTHLRGLFNHTNHNTLIFDEDPARYMFEMSSMNISDLKSIDFDLKDESLKPLINQLDELDCNTVQSSIHHEVDEFQIKEIIKNSSSITNNVMGYFSSSSCVKDADNPDIIRYMIRRDLPKDKKVLIMSATIQEEVYKAIYGDRVKVIDLTHIEQIGKVIQYADRSYSRASLKGLSEDDILKRCMGKKVITFKTMKDVIPEAVDEMHFHNTEGFDTLKGEDVVVLGTPHLPEITYKFYAHELGYNITDEDLAIKQRRVERNGYRFTFATFSDIRWQQLQLNLIESELIQAIGRARVLRTNATVEVFSNLPLAISDEIHIRYEE